MGATDQQIARLRRDIELLKQNQVVIVDTEPRVPSKQSIWRSETGTKWWDGKNWQQDTSAGGILNFSSSVVFTSSSRTNITWSNGVINLGMETGTSVNSISNGSFTMTGNTFIYWSPDMPNSFQTTTNPEAAVQGGGIIVAVGIPNSDTSATSAAIKNFGNGQSDLITGDQIVANSITSNKLSSQLVYAGSLVIDTNGKIRGGQTNYATGTGFFLGYSSGAYKFSIGDSNKYMRWDGTNFTIQAATIKTADTGARIEMSGSVLRSYDASSNVIYLDSSNNRIAFQNGAYITYLKHFLEGGSVSYLQTDARFQAASFKGGGAHFTGGLYMDGSPISFDSPTSGNSNKVQISSPNSDTFKVEGVNIWFNSATWSINGYSGLSQGVLYSNGAHLYFNGNQII